MCLKCTKNCGEFLIIFISRFLDNTDGKKTPSASILDVGVEQALNFSGFDEKMFLKRGGRYVWSKKDREMEW